MVLYWDGERVDEMTKGELIEALRTACELWHEARLRVSADLSMTTTNTKTPIHHIPTKHDEDKYTV